MSSNYAYQNIRALSHSLIVACRDMGYLPAWRESVFNPDRVQALPTDALEQGQLYHCLIQHPEIVKDADSFTDEMNICLEPSARTPKDELLKTVSVDDTTKIFIFPFGASRTTKKYESLRGYLQATNQWTDDAIVCTQAEFDTVCDNIRFMFVHPHYQFLEQFERVATELPVEFTLDDNPTKAELDAVYKLSDDRYLVVDWKTTRFTTRRQIQTCGESMGYHIQDYIYRNACARHFGVPVENVSMCFMLQNKKHPEIVYRAVFGKESYDQGESDFAEYGREFMARLNKFESVGIPAFMDICSELTFAHNPMRFLEPPTAEFGL